MEEHVKQRLKARIKERGMTQKYVCKAAGVSSSFLADVWRDKAKDPGSKKLESVLAIVGWRVEDLYGGEAKSGLQLPLQHRIQANEMWVENGPGRTKKLDLSFLTQDLISLEVETDAYEKSGYRRGDVVSGAKSFGRHIDNLIGCDCICQTSDGRQLFKLLKRRAGHGKYVVGSFDARSKIEDETVKITWAAPVQMILRGF